MIDNFQDIITSTVVELQDGNGCWLALDPGDKDYPNLKHYAPIYSATLWTMILLADIQADPNCFNWERPLKAMTNHFLDDNNNIFSIGKSHFPIPCLNGNMLYLYGFFKKQNDQIINSVVDFFSRHQRFDDGDFKTPTTFPYHANRSCYGAHTCYWGVIKLLKGLSFIPVENRTANANKLIKKCIEFVLLHEVCFSSHNKTEFLHTNIKKLTFPNMYQADFLEILWILKREKVHSAKMQRALDLLKHKEKPDNTWEIERQIQGMILPIGKKSFGNELVTRRASEVMEYYNKVQLV